MQPTAQPSNSKAPLLGVQYLRAIAALMVAYFHLIGQIPNYSAIFRQDLLGWMNLSSGVDIFFVISGFIMLISSRNCTPGQFVVRRLVRIAPLYWLLTTVLAVIVIISPNLFRTTIVTMEYYLKSMLFVPYHNPGHDGEFLPMLVPGWSLNFEMFFYAAFAVLLVVPLKLRVLISALMFLSLVCIGFVFRQTQYTGEFLFFADIRLFEFWLGMLIAHCHLNGWIRLPRTVGWLLVVVGFSWILSGLPGPEVIPAEWAQIVFSTMLPSAVIVLGVVAVETNGGVFNSPTLKLLGDASYSIYLSHIFSLGVARLIWTRLSLDHVSIGRVVAFAFFSMFLVVMGSLLTYFVAEKPMLEWGQRLIRKLRPSSL